MAKLSTGILGRTTGKVANVVGGNWKGINYIREKVTPRNPRTPLQQAQRSNMRLAVAWVLPLIGSLITPFINRFTTRMSGYNAVVSRNVMNFEGLATANDILVTPANTFDNRFSISRGSLALPGNLAITTSTATKAVAWSAAASPFLVGTDQVVYSVSALDGSVPPVVKQAAVSAETVAMTTQEATPFLGKKILVSVFVIRYTHTDTLTVPQSISNSTGGVFTGS